MNTKFVYILMGLEGSAADSHVLRDVITIFVTMNIQIVRAFLLHTKMLDTSTNLSRVLQYKHTRARNVIEHTFVLLEMHWEYFVVHRGDGRRSIREGLDEYISNQQNEDTNNNINIVESLDTTPEWTTGRDTIATNMFNEWRKNAPNGYTCEPYGTVMQTKARYYT
ncbi:hypothetical protein ACS0TY_034732 [Phlomoides rotata]